MASAKTNDESMSNLWEECWFEQQLTQASFAESTQEAIFRECGQCNDDGDTKSFGCTQNKSRWECKPHTETISLSYGPVTVGLYLVILLGT